MGKLQGKDLEIYSLYQEEPNKSKLARQFKCSVTAIGKAIKRADTKLRDKERALIEDQATVKEQMEALPAINTQERRRKRLEDFEEIFDDFRKQYKDAESDDDKAELIKPLKQLSEEVRKYCDGLDGGNRVAVLINNAGGNGSASPEQVEARALAILEDLFPPGSADGDLLEERLRLRDAKKVN